MKLSAAISTTSVFVSAADMMPTSLASSGHMSVLGGSVVDGKCEYAGTTHGGAKSTAATSPHVVSGRYCGVSEKMFAGGASCGACYKVSYSGEGGTNPGHAGSAVVQVVNQASEVFACHKDVFHTITGATTGIFPITYTEVACEVDSPVGVATVLDGKNAYYTKAIFSDLPHAVSSAKLKIGEKSFQMDRVAGATFKANTDGSQASASFELTLADGSINKLAPCFKSWPVATDSSCAPAAVQLEAPAPPGEGCPLAETCVCDKWAGPTGSSTCHVCSKSPEKGPGMTGGGCECGARAVDWIARDQLGPCSDVDPWPSCMNKNEPEGSGDFATWQFKDCNIMQFAKGRIGLNPTISTLVSAVVAGDLADALTSPGPFTIFAPLNTAFEALPVGTLDNLLKPENKATLVDILNYHVLPLQMHMTDWDETRPQAVKTIEGKTLQVVVDPYGDTGTCGCEDYTCVKVGPSLQDLKAQTYCFEILLSNAAMYVIDGVLLPPSSTVDIMV